MPVCRDGWYAEYMTRCALQQPGGGRYLHMAEWTWMRPGRSNINASSCDHNRIEGNKKAGDAPGFFFS
jgi:hypothetical protein